MALPASSSGLFRFLSPRSRPQSTDIVAAATWGVFAGTAGLYLVQISGLRSDQRLIDRSIVVEGREYLGAYRAVRLALWI
ncbi:hypothetical protein C2845_PM03G16380 [Panicum miliaceum]|uniref:Uncharacterized protein n=1 Tax=Panicum miliaceum TaxID=4540 RepID=A0A3L6T8Y2_PANMI|nr:hypothetical protein C2845_PM03G16380 [Panicum miliaceum]